LGLKCRSYGVVSREKNEGETKAEHAITFGLGVKIADTEKRFRKKQSFERLKSSFPISLGLISQGREHQEFVLANYYL